METKDTSGTVRAIKIAALNDALRTTAQGGMIAVTPSILELSPLNKVFERVRDYSVFDKDNDPRGEHDFGAFTFQGQQVFWKIDYYNADCSAGSEDPADSTKTTRVMTIMLASEY